MKKRIWNHGSRIYEKGIVHTCTCYILYKIPCIKQQSEISLFSLTTSLCSLRYIINFFFLIKKNSTIIVLKDLQGEMNKRQRSDCTHDVYLRKLNGGKMLFYIGIDSHEEWVKATLHK